MIRENQTIDKIKYYCLRNAETNRKVSKRFIRTELFALKNNFFSLKPVFIMYLLSFNKFYGLKTLISCVFRLLWGN